MRFWVAMALGAELVLSGCGMFGGKNRPEAAGGFGDARRAAGAGDPLSGAEGLRRRNAEADPAGARGAAARQRAAHGDEGLRGRTRRPAHVSIGSASTLDSTGDRIMTRGLGAGEPAM